VPSHPRRGEPLDPVNRARRPRDTHAEGPPARMRSFAGTRTAEEIIGASLEVAGAVLGSARIRRSGARIGRSRHVLWFSQLTGAWAALELRSLLWFRLRTTDRPAVGSCLCSRPWSALGAGQQIAEGACRLVGAC